MKKFTVTITCIASISLTGSVFAGSFLDREYHEVDYSTYIETHMTTALLGNKTSTTVLIKTYGPEYNRTCVNCLDKKVSCTVSGSLIHKKSDGCSLVVAAGVGRDTAKSIGIANIVQKNILWEAFVGEESRSQLAAGWQVSGTSKLTDSVTYDVPMNTYWVNKWEAEKIESTYYKIEYEYWQAQVKQNKESEWQTIHSRRHEEASQGSGVNYENLRKVKGCPKKGPA